MSATESGYLKCVEGFVKVGDKVNVLKSSWDRPGMIMCEGSTGEDASINAQINKSKILFRVVDKAKINKF